MRAQKERGRKFCKPLILPCLAELIAPDHRIPPLMRRLVRDDERDLLFPQIVRDHRQHGVFHPAVREIRLHDGIGGISVLSELCGIVGETLLRRRQRTRGRGVVQIVVCNGHAVRAALQDLKALGAYHGEVAHPFGADMVCRLSV